jgi:hypothetical protein
MFLLARFPRMTCGVLVCTKDDGEPVTRRPIRAEVECLVANVKTDQARYLEEHSGELAQWASTLEITPDVLVQSFPLGLIATDHVGYCSFDLEPLHEMAEALAIPPEEGFTIVRVVRALRLFPMGADAIDVFDLERQVRSDDAYFVPLELPRFILPQHWLEVTLPSMQTPRLTDWRLSPGSFAANPSLLIGTGGCESIQPAQHTLKTYRFAEIIRFTNAKLDLIKDADTSVDSGPTRIKARLGVALDYRTDWYHLGHSLGQIIYSQPLAPCESVKLAVINWSRQDNINRTDDAKVTENLLHEQRRERVVEETVNATLREHQSGGSFMAGLGLAGKAIGSAMAGAGVLSIGGATSSSEGTRRLAGNSLQKLNDTITQATSVTRDLYSTVVIQANQAEQNALETRTFTNNNHCHALTILYYEVLRHLRVVSRWVGRRPVVLIHHDLIDFNDESNIRTHRRVLEAGLLEDRLKPCFDAADKLLCLQIERKVTLAASQADTLFFEFFAEWVTGSNDEDQSSLWFSLLLKDGSTVKLNRSPSPGGDPGLHQGKPFTFPPGAYANSHLRPATGPVPYSAIKAVRIEFIGIDYRDNERTPRGGDWLLGALKLKGISATGERTVFDGLLNAHLGVGFASLPGENNPDKDTFDIGVWSPEPKAAVPSSLAALEDLPGPERCCLARLKEHLMAHREYYSRLVWLARDPNQRATEYDAITVAAFGVSLLDFVDNRPIEVLGTTVAFAIREDFWTRLQDDRRLGLGDVLEPPHARVAESLLTVPTRGVFAEAKLGHCNGCEEIDDTRYWQWQESPCPCEAPDITDVSPGPRGQTPSVEQTTMPSPVVNIVNPPAAPDPTGLAGALKLLGEANIFRDMSMAKELGGLLQTLAQQAAGMLKPAEPAKPGAATTTHTGNKGTDGGGASPTTSNQPTVTPRTAQATDKTIKSSGASQATKQQALDQNVRNAVGLPAPFEAPRYFNFDVKWWTGGPDLGADFEVFVKDHANLEYTLGTYNAPDGSFSATLPDELWKSFTDSGSIGSVRLIARNAVCPPRNLSLHIPELLNDHPTVAKTLPTKLPVVHQETFTASELLGKTNAITKPASGNVLRFTAVAARRETIISVEATLGGAGELAFEAAPSIAQKIATEIPLAALVGGAGAGGAGGAGAGGAGAGNLAGELAFGLALKAAPKLSVAAGGKVVLPINVDFLDHRYLTLMPVVDSSDKK